MKTEIVKIMHWHYQETGWFKWEVEYKSGHKRTYKKLPNTAKNWLANAKLTDVSKTGYRGRIETWGE